MGTHTKPKKPPYKPKHKKPGVIKKIVKRKTGK